jgi:putative ATPase
MILWGPAGTGKTTLARLIAEQSAFHFVTLSAVSSGVKDVRDVIAGARERLSHHGTRTCLFIDEVHRFNKSQQDLLLPVTESGEIVLIGATTENPYFEVNAALMSRTTLWRLAPHSPESLALMIAKGLEAKGATISDDAQAALIASVDGDGRAVLTTLDVAILLSGSSRHIDLDTVTLARDGRLMHQGADSHYDQTSAFIKSIRGSDPDAALFWMVALLEGGETARFIARRLVILASEDVGLAQSQGLVIAEAAHRAVEFVGLPEARLILAHATVELALMPKSNSVTRALANATDALRRASTVEVPIHLRDGHYSGAHDLGHGSDYLYPHDFPDGWADQQYLPDGIVGGFYEPSPFGSEAAKAALWRERRGQVESPPVE